MKICLNPAKKDFTSFWVCKHLKAGQSAKHPLSFFAVKNSKTPYLQKILIFQNYGNKTVTQELWSISGSSPLLFQQVQLYGKVKHRVVQHWWKVIGVKKTHDKAGPDKAVA